jgi:outer membrane immunogenic protein
MRTMFLAGAAFASAVAAPAVAQNAEPFTGPHIEGIIGYDILKSPDTDLDEGADGLLYGVAGGYDFQLGGAVAGIEGEVTGATSNQRGNDLLLTGDSARLKTDRDFYIGGRVGVGIGPSTLLYAKGGYTNLRIKSRYNDGTGAILNEGVTLDGYRLGAGVEQKFNLFGPSGFIKAEYRYSNYKNLDFGSVDIDTDLDRHQIVAGVGVRF